MFGEDVFVYILKNIMFELCLNIIYLLDLL